MLKNILLMAIQTAVAAAAGSVITSLNRDFADSLAKPPWYPPDWLFGVVWTVIYALIVVAGVVALQKSPSRRETENIIFAFNIQLVLNLLWTVLFFGCRMLWPSFAEILLLLTVIIVMIIIYRRASSAAAWLLVPYLIWTAFAAFFLNLPLAIMN